jgi:nucleotide-binding universal stress UspA family protein
MQKAKRILVGLDDSRVAESILPYVGGLARGLESEVVLLKVIHLPETVEEDMPPAALEDMVSKLTSIAEDYLKTVAARLQGQGLRTTTAVTVAENVADEIARFARRESIDIIALATHARSGLSRWAYGSVAEEALHKAHLPLLMVRPSEGDDAVPALPISRVLVTLDGSTLSEAALPWATTVARSLGVPMTLLRSIETIYTYNSGVIDWETGEYHDVMSTLTERAQVYLDATAVQLRDQGFTVDTVAGLLPAPAEIEDFVKGHPGTLVVMSTHGRSGVAGAILGSVARQVIRSLGTPVLVVRPSLVGGHIDERLTSAARNTVL